MTDPSLSIIIATWNRKQDLLSTAARALQEEFPSREVIVVDNGSEDGTGDEVAKQFPQIRLVRLDKNLGHTGAQNAGARLALGKYLVLLDDDSYPENGSLQSAYDLIERQEDVGAVAANVYLPHSRRWEALRFFRSIPESPADVPWFLGCGAIVRRDVFNRVGGYSAEFVNYFDDQELSFRILNAGYRIVLDPHALFVHTATATNRSTARYVYLLTRNGLWFIRSAYRGRPAWEYGVVLSALNGGAALLSGDHRLAASFVKGVWHGVTEPRPVWNVVPDRVAHFSRFMDASFTVRALITRAGRRFRRPFGGKQADPAGESVHASGQGKVGQSR